MELFRLVGKIAIDSSEADRTITATIEASEELASMLGNVATKADNAGDKLNSKSRIGAGAVWLGNTLHSLTSKLGHFAASAIKSGLDFNASIEKYQVQFSSLLRNEEQAQVLIEQIRELAKISPLGMEGLAQNAVELLSAGTELADIIPTLEMLGNLSLGDSTKMDYVVRAYTQIMNTGKLKAQEINQLINAGVPVIRLLTEYGGDKFADGTWYQKFLDNPKEFYVTAEEFRNAMAAATSEAGSYATIMDDMMKSYSGQLEKLGDEANEAAGAFMKPFNEVLSSKVFPKISELLGSFETWAGENTEAIGVFAEAVGDFATWALQGLIDGIKYLVEHGPELAETIKEIVSAIGPVLQTIGTFFGIGKGERQEDYVAQAIANEAPSAYQKYAGRYAHWNEAQQDAAREYIGNSLLGYDDAHLLQGIGLTNEAINNFRADISELISSGEYAVEIEDAMFAPATEAELQGQLNGYSLTVDVKPVLSSLTGWVGNLISGAQAESNNASGLRYVPHDNYLANLHVGETVLPRNEAEAYRKGGNGNGADYGRLESAIMRLEGIMQQVAMNTGMGQTIVLDSGVLVGQTVRQMDTQLGAITTRKGRRN